MPVVSCWRMEDLHTLQGDDDSDEEEERHSVVGVAA
jgi:hypothetical protein